MNLNNGYKRIGLYGISGIGKTTILKEVNGLSEEVVWLEGSKLILETSNLSLAEFKKKSEETKYILRERAIDKAAEIQTKRKKHIIIDGHLAFAKPDNTFENVMTLKDGLFYTHFIYLKLAPEVIKYRQENDTVKKRSYTLHTIEKWIEYEERELILAAQKNNINISFLNSEKVNDCVSYLLEVINK